jgi:hypothetical protein
MQLKSGLFILSIQGYAGDAEALQDLSLIDVPAGRECDIS